MSAAKGASEYGASRKTPAGDKICNTAAINAVLFGGECTSNTNLYNRTAEIRWQAFVTRMPHVITFNASSLVILETAHYTLAPQAGLSRVLTIIEKRDKTGVAKREGPVLLIDIASPCC